MMRARYALPKPASKEPTRGPGLAEAGVLGGDGQVADDVQDVAAADGDAVDRGDDGLGDVADETVEGLDLEEAALGGAVVAGFLALFLVAAGAEGLVAGAGQGDDADLAVGPGALEAENEFVDGAAPEGVEAVGPVDRDPGQPVVDFIEDVGEFLEFHASPPPGFRNRMRSILD
jgi:hypothetical protein